MVKAVCVVVGDAKGNVYFEQVSKSIAQINSKLHTKSFYTCVCFIIFIFLMNGKASLQL